MCEKWSNAILKCSVKVKCGFCSCGRVRDNSFFNRPGKIFLILKYNSRRRLREQEKRGVVWIPKKKSRNWKYIVSWDNIWHRAWFQSLTLLLLFCFVYTGNYNTHQGSGSGPWCCEWKHIHCCSSSSPLSASRNSCSFISRLLLD